ncbi:hypothetical protein EVAR_65351_1 [Eumeta japonica]|uniref:Uncharacterized protein n=1 Tax=Eumeta variegata TaxID=151549 RepID=A0A4C1Z6C3_EUMVA|nr:hypothetical protein EVAR_65351_1 [Eumeta japonica]
MRGQAESVISQIRSVIAAAQNRRDHPDATNYQWCDWAAQYALSQKIFIVNLLNKTLALVVTSGVLFTLSLLRHRGCAGFAATSVLASAASSDRKKDVGFKRSTIEAVVWSLWFSQCCVPWSWSWFGAVAVAVTAALWAVSTYRHDYWRSRGVFSPPALPLVGHIWSVVTFREQGGILFKRIYDKYKDYRFLGQCGSEADNELVCDAFDT